MSFARRLSLAAVAAAAVMGAAQPARADIVFGFGSTSATLAGTKPTAAGDYATATFSYVSPTQVQLSLHVTGIVTGLNVNQAAFNFNATGASLGSLISGVTASGLSFSTGNVLLNSNNEPFNTLITYPNSPVSSRLNDTNPDSKYTINLTGLTVASDLSNLFKPNTHGYFAGAHLRNYRNSTTGPELNVSVAAVPEPSGLMLGALSSTVGLGLTRLRRVRDMVFGAA